MLNGKSTLILAMMLVTCLASDRVFAQDSPTFPIEKIVNVTVAGENGFPLQGTLYKSISKGPAVLLIHQFGTGQRWDYEPLATQLVMRGIHVLTIDLRGHGDSITTDSIQTSAFDLTPNDIEAVYQFLLKQEVVDKTQIGVMGASGSVAEAIYLASKHTSIQAIVGLSGHADQGGLAYLNSSGAAAILGVGAEDDPMMIKIAGEWQPVTGASSMQRAVAQSSHPDSKLITYAEAGHGTHMFSNQKELEPTISSWFVERLGVAEE